MSDTTIFKLKDYVTEEDLVQAGFIIKDYPKTDFRLAIKKVYDEYDFSNPTGIIIPLEKCAFEERVIQYNTSGTEPEDLNPEHIEDLIALEFVEEIEK